MAKTGASPADDTNKVLRDRHWHFYFVASRAVIRAEAEQKLFEKWGARFPTAKGLSAQVKMLTHLTNALDAIITAQMFAGMTAEAYINKFIHSKCKGYDRENLDKLSMPAKWRVVPALVHPGKGITPDSHIIAGLKKVKQVRDDLAHYKPQMMEVETTDQLGQKIAEAKKLVDHVADAILKLHEIDPDFEGDFVVNMKKRRAKGGR